ncbi:transglutaminase domain-containing protein [Butyrivibrio sp. LC3010]|uniref:transglutaminase domain-containing protein n=1 Tax=Butyrivibrio sp. LC3010 TaxID=1280680 RepID=UPI000414EA36|nr:transglutaminase domain-containing protein [Butyrivibrio sp. LC3010]
MQTINHNENTSYLSEDRKSSKKHKKGFPFKTLIFIVLIIAIYVLFIEDDNSIVPASIRSEITGKYFVYDTPDVPSKREDIYVLYSSLNDADKCVYNMFLDLVENKNIEKYESAVSISETKNTELGDDYLWNVFYAMCYDHPEYFYLLIDPSMVECYTVEKNDYITYIFNMKDTATDEDPMVKKLEQATDDFLKDIDITASDEEIELAIHDKLLDTVTYDSEILESMDKDDYQWDLGNTAYGALVADSAGRTNHAVCSGYAFAFEYLLQKSGIPCAYITGSANTIPSSEKDQPDHAWNAVKINNRWYETDVTWDDNEFEEDEEFAAMLKKDTEKYFNLCHQYYNKTTKEMEFIPATDDTLFEIEGYEPYNASFDTKHIRSTEGTDDFTNSLIPIAE